MVYVLCVCQSVFFVCVAVYVCLIAVKEDTVRFWGKRKSVCDCLVSRRKSFSVFGLTIWTHHIDRLMYCCILYKHTLVSLCDSLLWKRHMQMNEVSLFKIHSAGLDFFLCVV